MVFLFFVIIHFYYYIYKKILIGGGVVMRNTIRVYLAIIVNILRVSPEIYPLGEPFSWVFWGLVWFGLTFNLIATTYTHFISVHLGLVWVY